MSRGRHVVTNLFVALDTFAPVLDECARSERRIVESDGDFDVASEELARIAGTLLDLRPKWTHAALFGEVLKSADDADAVAQECFADLSTRYLSGPDGTSDAHQVDVQPGERRAVVMLTLAYQGEEPALERDVADAVGLEEALRAIVSLHHRGRLLVAHIHHAPAHPEDRLTDEQMLVNYPELMSL